MAKYGIDEYSRYVEDDDGERYCVEPWPFWRLRYLPFDAWSHIVARIEVGKWHAGIIRQHGVREWLKLRQF